MFPDCRSIFSWLLVVLRVRRDRALIPTVGGLRRWIVYRPLAIALALLLMMPVVSQFEGGGAGARLFLAPAAAGSGCGPAFPNAIIQVACANGELFNLFGDLTQLENDAVNAYLGMHHLPSTDAGFIYTLGRPDLRNAIRGNMLSILLGIAAKPASSRTQHEQVLYRWFQTLVQQNEIGLYTNAINAFNSWETSPCTFVLDSTIASEYNLYYNGAPFCYASEGSLFGGPPIPAESYFTAYGLKQSYGAPANTYPNFASLTAGTALGVAEVAGIATAAGSVIAAGSAGVLAASLTAALAVFTSSGSLLGAIEARR